MEEEEGALAVGARSFYATHALVPSQSKSSPAHWDPSALFLHEEY